MQEDKFIDKIRPLAQQLHNLHQIQLDWAKKEVNLIVKQAVSDILHIEQVAEVLLEAALFGIGLEEFRSFMRYLWFEVDGRGVYFVV